MALVAWGMGPEVCSTRVAATPFIASQVIIARCTRSPYIPVKTWHVGAVGHGGWAKVGGAEGVSKLSQRRNTVREEPHYGH